MDLLILHYGRKFKNTSFPFLLISKPFPHMCTPDIKRVEWACLVSQNCMVSSQPPLISSYADFELKQALKTLDLWPSMTSGESLHSKITKCFDENLNFYYDISVIIKKTIKEEQRQIEWLNNIYCLIRKYNIHFDRFKVVFSLKNIHA